MDTSDPALVTVEVGLAPSTGAGAAVDLRTGHVAVATSSVVPRKRLGNVIVQGGAPAPGAAMSGAAAKGATPAPAAAAATNLDGTPSGQRVKRKVVAKRGKRDPPAKKAATISPPTTTEAQPVFDGMPARYVRYSLAGILITPTAYPVRSSGVHDSQNEYASLLDDNAVNIEDAPLGSFGYNDMDGGVDGGGEEEDELEEIEGEVFEASQSAKCSKRSKSYTQLEDEVLVRAWEAVSLDAVHGTDQTGKRYWQRIEDKFFRLMPKNVEKTPRTYRSLQGRWDVIKTAVSRWSGCVEQVHNAPPSGTNEGDWEKIAAARYKDMPASKGKPFVFEHCWTLLKNSEKWKVRDKEAPPKRGAFTKLDDDEDDDVAPGERNKNKPEGNKKAKDNMKRDSEASNLRDKIDHLVNSNELMVAKTLEARKELAMKRSQEKEEKWQVIKEEKFRKAAIEEKRAAAEENKAIAKLLAEENKIMTMNRDEMDELTKEWHDMARKDILKRRRLASIRGDE